MFPSKKSYENIDMIIRRHRIALLFNYLYFGFLLVLGFAIYYLADYFLSLKSIGFGEFEDFFLLVYLLFLWQAFFRSLMDYYLDSWILTDHRIIDIHQIGLFKRDISELRYSKIQDISVKVNGFWATMLNYGDVVIQTAGAVQEFKFHQIPKPNQVKDRILHLYDEFTRQHPNDIEIHEGVNNQIASQ